MKRPCAQLLLQTAGRGDLCEDGPGFDPRRRIRRAKRASRLAVVEGSIANPGRVFPRAGRTRPGAPGRTRFRYFTSNGEFARSEVLPSDKTPGGSSFPL
jgi:hypothetical protein